jgi:hypothetical protein
LADALRAIFGAWLPLLHSTGLHVPIYQRNMGLDAPWSHVGRALIEFGALAVIVGLCAWRLTRPALKPLERVIFFALAGGASINYGWQKSGHALPLLLIVAAILWWREWQKVTRDEWQVTQKASASNPVIRHPSPGTCQRGRLIFPALWLAFSFFMLAKLGFNPWISHYGVFLAMPAFLSAIYLLLHLLPRFLEGVRIIPNPQRVNNADMLRVETTRAPAGDTQSCHLSPFRVAILIFLLAGLARLAIQSGLFYKDKDFTLGSGGDRMMTYDPKIDPTGAAMGSAVAWIKTHTAPTNTLAVLPEGVMLNYLTRRDNPTPYVVFAFEVWAFGEQNMLAAYEKNPPDYIVLVQRDSSEYGVPYFGLQKSYGFDVMQWVRRNYSPCGVVDFAYPTAVRIVTPQGGPVELIGSEPLQNGVFGIKILKHLPPEMPARQ